MDRTPWMADPGARALQDPRRPQLPYSRSNAKPPPSSAPPADLPIPTSPEPRPAGAPSAPPPPQLAGAQRHGRPHAKLLRPDPLFHRSDRRPASFPRCSSRCRTRPRPAGRRRSSPPSFATTSAVPLFPVDRLRHRALGCARVHRPHVGRLLLRPTRQPNGRVVPHHPAPRRPASLRPSAMPFLDPNGTASSATPPDPVTQFPVSLRV